MRSALEENGIALVLHKEALPILAPMQHTNNQDTLFVDRVGNYMSTMRMKPHRRIELKTLTRHARIIGQQFKDVE